jgi:hypothetical protein
MIPYARGEGGPRRGVAAAGEGRRDASGAGVAMAAASATASADLILFAPAVFAPRTVTRAGRLHVFAEYDVAVNSELLPHSAAVGVRIVG